MDSGLRDKVVFVTGASGGIGRACARAFAEEGARLVLHGLRNRDALESLRQELETPVLCVTADVKDRHQVKAMFGEAVARFGTVHALVVNAGVWRPKPTPIHKMTINRWNDTLGVNLTGAFLCAREFFRILDRERPETASLVLVGSTAAVFGEADHCEYAASKAGLVQGLMKSLKNEIVRLAPRGRVNAVCPGWTLTEMAKEGLADPEAARTVLRTRAHARLARPEDVARAIVFLSSDRLAGHVTGEALMVSGGMEGRVIHEAEDIDPKSI